MFFWGSYNFPVPQLTDSEDRPPLRYPMHVPPGPYTPTNSPGGAARAVFAAAAPTSELLDQALSSIAADAPLHVEQVACGLKHLIAVLKHPTTGARTLYGMGSNHQGQLGSRVATYTNTFIDLQAQDFGGDGSEVASIACGARHSLISTSSGCVYASGENTQGQLGLGPSFLPGATVSRAAAAEMAIHKFRPIPTLAHIASVHANHNSSFALDRKGVLFSWGNAESGHLGHNDTGERLNIDTLKNVFECVSTPMPVRWFVQRRITVVEVAVGKAHLACRSETEVYTCGEAYFGKLGHGNVEVKLEPTRVEFPPRKQPEQLIALAAGDDHTLVLRDSPAVGSVVYFFGRLSNSDGQLVPIIIPIPSSAPIRAIAAGRGNQCFAITNDGLVYGWGQHLRASNGTNASAQRSTPSVLEVLDRYHVQQVVIGGSFVVAVADPHHQPAAFPTPVKTELLDGAANEEVPVPTPQPGREWDLMVPHDFRVGRLSASDPNNVYEAGVRRFLRQYLGDALGTRYADGLPTALPLTAKPVYPFDRIGARQLTPGQKVRLWMTDVYALATVIEALPQKNENEVVVPHTMDSTVSIKMEEGEQEAKDTIPVKGQRVRLDWQRDDWREEVLSLYSSDETLAEDNLNRWQPFWFEKCPTSGQYIAA